MTVESNQGTRYLTVTLSPGNKKNRLADGSGQYMNLNFEMARRETHEEFHQY
jgi:hypothetical protein